MANVLLTKDSKASDFHCTCGCGEGELDPTFMSQLLRFLEFTDRGFITITSGYRCEAHNKAIGGETFSFHLRGRAADILTPTIQFKTLALDAANKAGFHGIGLGSTFTHVDNREIPARWTYPKKS